MTIDYNMNSLIVNEGTYFIKNGRLDKYIQIDDGDSSNNYNTENAILEVWEGTGVSFQKWIFEYLHNGYYKIKSYRSGKVVSVKEGNENSNNKALVQQTYNGSYRQQWQITLTSSGKYKIKPRSSETYGTDWVMCIGEGIGENGRNVEQRPYTNNSTYKDEWTLEKVYYDVRLLAFDETYIIRDEYFEPTKNVICNVRTDDIQEHYYKECSKDRLIHLLKNCKLFFIHTHGRQDGIYNGSTYLTISDLNNIDLSNLEMALLLTCDTGIGGYSQSRVDLNSPINIVEKMVCCGAETVIGFNEETYVSDCNKFALDFAIKTMNNHLAVEDAINSIDYSTFYKDMSLIAVIGGNADNEIWN